MVSHRPDPPAARSWSRWVLALSLLLTTGCKEAADLDSWTDDYTFVRDSQTVTVYGYGRSDEDVCAGSFWALDTHTRALMDFFGSDESLGYDYHWLSQEAWEEVGPEACPVEGIACAWWGEPRTRWLPDMHEITHAITYASPTFGCPSVLSEGLAEYFSKPSYGSGGALKGDMAEILTERIDFEFYPRAGHFASFFIETFGVDAIVAMCATIPPGHTIADWDAATRDILGMSIDDLLAEYDEYPECIQQQYRARLWECAGEPDFVFGVPCSADPQVFRYVDLPEFYTYRAGMHEIVLFVDLEHGDSVTMVMTRW